MAIHRWFSGGEGWAYHPELSGCIRELADAVKPELVNRTPHFEKRLGRKVLLGCQVTDQECPDPRAQGRAPTIVRIASLPKTLSLESCDALFRRLADLDAAQPGQNELLCVRLDESELVESKRSWRASQAMIKAVGGIMLVGIFLLWQVYGPPVSPTDEWARKYTADEMEKLLREKWHVEMASGKQFPADIRKQFFRFLSQEGCLVDDGVRHPDAQFWARLPSHAPAKIPDDLEGLHRELKGLAQRMALKVPATPDLENARSLDGFRKQLPQLFEIIDAGMDYRRWMESESQDLRASTMGQVLKFPWDERSPQNVRHKIVTHFLPTGQSSVSLSKEDVLTMVEQLNGWGVQGILKEDAEDRPWFVCDCYLEFLSQSRFGAVEPKSSWYEAFVARLPKKPPINMVADRESKKNFMKDALQPLARGLGLEPSELVLTSTLLTDIGDHLEYEAWRKECDSQIERLARTLQDDLARAAPELKTKTEEYDIAPYGRVKIEVTRDNQGTPFCRIDKNKLNEKSKNVAINDFVERFRPRSITRASQDKTKAHGHQDALRREGA